MHCVTNNTMQKIVIFLLLSLFITLTHSSTVHAEIVGGCYYYSEDCTVCNDGLTYGSCLNNTENIQPFYRESCELIDNNCLVCDDYIFYGCEDLNDSPINNSLDKGNFDDCHISICLAGGFGDDSPANKNLDHFCGTSAVTNPIQKCTKKYGCRNIWNSAIHLNKYQVYPALFKAMDFNKDGRIDHLDPKCKIDLIGYSWGGVAAYHISRYLYFDNRIDQQHKRVAHLVTFDAYQPFAYKGIEIQPNVLTTTAFIRHSVPEDDCSLDEFGGPYRGLYPRCQNGTDCKIYNWSTLNQYVPYSVFGYNGHIHSKNVSHCTVLGTSIPAATKFLADQPYNGILPSVITPEEHWPTEENPLFSDDTNN